MVWRGLLPPPSLPDSRTDRAGSPHRIWRSLPLLCPGPTGLLSFRYHASRGNPSEEVRDGPHGANRGVGNRGGGASTVAVVPLKPRPGRGLVRGPGLYNAPIVGRVVPFA